MTLIFTKNTASYHMFDMQKCKHIGDFACALDIVIVVRGASQSKQIMFSYVVPQGVIFKSACIVHRGVRSPFSEHDGCAFYSRMIRVII